VGLLHHGTDEPWPISVRRRRLVDLIAPGSDGITEAALFALVTYAWIDPTARSDVAAVVSAQLDEAISAHGPAIARSVAQLALATPRLGRATRDLAACLLVTEQQHAQPRILRQRRRTVRRRGARRLWLRWPPGGPMSR
jgi:hypothetical protein